MATYTLPREAFDLLEEAFGERHKAEVFAKAMERAIDAIDEKAKESIVDKKEHIKIEVKEDLKKELVTREIFEKEMKVIDERFNVVDERFKNLEKVMDERFKVVDEKFKSLNFKLNIFIAIALLSLTLANPTFVELIKRIF
ncbi:MAG: hypothetical protein HZA07_05780 [Nitrospirae bacterium]|nr:hypothetical protein [Nitrospirota bacterium]